MVVGEGHGADPDALAAGLRAESQAAVGSDFRQQVATGGRVRLLKGPLADWLGRMAWVSDAVRLHVIPENPGSEREVETDAGSGHRLRGLRGAFPEPVREGGRGTS
jgi:hypothetical protein